MIVDIQYYPLNGLSILKEATVLSMDGSICRHFVFQCNYNLIDANPNDRKTIDYIHEKLGVLHLHCGNDTLVEFQSFTSASTAHFLFVNGHVKKTILKSYFPNHRIIDIKIPFRIMPTSFEKKCDFSCFHKLCSLTNVYKIRNFLLAIN